MTTYAHTNTCTHMTIVLCTHADAHTHTHTRTHTHTHTHTHNGLWTLASFGLWLDHAHILSFDSYCDLHN